MLDNAADYVSETFPQTLSAFAYRLRFYLQVGQDESENKTVMGQASEDGLIEKRISFPSVTINVPEFAHLCVKSFAKSLVILGT